MVQCFGRAFHYKDAMASFLISSGVPFGLVEKHRGEAKYVWARKVIQELESSEENLSIQRKILTDLCQLERLPDAGVEDKTRGLLALKRLRDLATQHDLTVKRERGDQEVRKRAKKEKEELLKDRARKLAELSKLFTESFDSTNRQQAGFDLEDILVDLFAISEMEYKKPYKIVTEQIDGYFKLDGFDYIVEARWRKSQPNFQAISGFKGKVDAKFRSTRGLFLSVVGFRPEVIEKFDVPGANIIFLDGMDLMLILEGRFALKDAIRFKVAKAAQEGKTYVPLSNM